MHFEFNWLSLGSLIFAAHTLGVIAACHAILNTRTSQGAIAWAVSLVAMPYLTLVPYLFLGRSKFSGYVDARRLESELIRSRAHPSTWDTRASTSGRPAEALGHHVVRALTHLSGMPFLPGNQARTLVNGDATFAAILDAIEQARDYVLVQFFIVRADALGEMLKDLLISKAAAGVRVCFLYDSIGSFDLPQRYVTALAEGGVEIHPFATNRRFVNRFQLNFRNHRKIVVVDGERAFVGGHNVGVEYLGGNPRLSPWRDTHIELRGPVVASVQFVFIEDWHWATQQLPRLERSATPEPQPAGSHDMHCLVVAPGPADKFETGSLFFVEAINAAQQRVWITTPYLVPDEAVFSALRLAVMRGVDVRIMIPSRRDHYVVFEASKLYAYDLVRAGVRIFRYRPGFLHQKVVLIDDVAAAVGSANLDNRSFRLNFEIMVLTVDQAFAAEVQAMLARDLELAYEVDRSEYRDAPAWRRVAMHIARLFSPIL
ncbi:cardiolipin synthase [Trinickia caryophylli]|uniref:Cardiolipin synthase A n=1 Tax=Trinickia caryophylli TaxID=28094 RepID=A0A1X7DJB7_TRICW|nr:cardiolipin synthase [Trinickia caryophylli]PMS12259.1 cardiolipin synthase [Trinickia caryophylli]TRX17073.1 cardiolipin synthase [Trinickia caryophylli]WQE12193.1 cardiolipin synthase [Trinickia caryophylli]SMF16611.1 cardiolipin synthetase 2 [Trinickia caryophylli]GLU31672.1 cardiolipin synthase A [Trinickia caryophylli]